MKIPVICKNQRYWRAFVSDNYEKITARKGWWEFKIDNDLYFYVLVDDKYKLYGLKLDKVIIYNCVPELEFMETLYSRFYENKIDIQEIWN